MFTFAPEINSEVWVSGRYQHVANVPNRKAPKVRILLLPQKMEVWQSWSIAPVLKTGRRKRLRGSNPLASADGT